MNKQAQRNYGVVIAFFSVMAGAILGLGACANPIQSRTERSSDGSTGVRISIAAGEARTLLPVAGFSKYVLSFATSDSVTVPGNVTLTGTNTGIIALDPADWTITATAYVDLGGIPVAVAEGSAEVSLSAGELMGVSIRVSSKPGGADGYFSYAISFPTDVSYGRLEVYDIDGSPEFDKDLLSDPSGVKLTLEPGYYRLRVSLQTDYGMANRTEILHIYTGLETRGDYAFTAADFGSPITISGTVNLTGLGTVSAAAIRLMRGSDFTYQEGYFIDSHPSGAAWAWTVRTLPFDQPTDLYMELYLQLSGGFLVKRLPVPVSVYDQDLAAPGLGPFTVSQLSLSGEVDLTELTALGITNISSASVTVYQDGSVPLSLGVSPVILTDQSWSYGIMTEETSLPARILLSVETYNGGIIYDEIQTTLTASRSDLDFRPGPINAGTTMNGRGIDLSYRYAFSPNASGDYVFTLSAAYSQYGVDLYLYDASGNSLGYSSGYPVATLSQTLTAGAVYYIDLELNSLYRDFQFQVDPVTQASLGGTVDFDDLLSPFDNITVDSASITVYADNSAHTQLGTAAIAVSDGSWSVTVDRIGSSTPAVFVIEATLSNNMTIYHQVDSSITGNDSGLNFTFLPVTGEGALTRVVVSQYDYLLYVPAAAGDYSLRISIEGNDYTGLSLYDAQTGNALGSIYGEGDLELVSSLSAGAPYRIQVYADGFTRQTYQFQAVELQPMTLSGTVSLNGLAPLTGADIYSTEILVFNGAANPVLLGSSTVGSGGAWSATVPALAPQAVRIVAYTYLNNGGIIISQRQDTISGDANGLNLSPAALAPVAGQPVVRTSGPGDDFFLLVPPAGGFFNLGAIGGSGSTPQLTVYTAAGAVLAQGNSSLYATLAAATPYIVQINNIGSFAAYQFQMTALSSTTIGGAVDYSRLPGSISAAISSATVSAWLDNPSHVQIASMAAVSGNAWSVPVPANAIGQAVRLELTLNLTNSRSISSRIQTVLAASASNLNFFPAAVASGALLNGATGGNGYDRFLFVPATSDLYTLRASSDTYITFRLYDGSTGSFIANSEYRYLSTELMETLEAATPYIIEVSPNWYNFRDYQFFVGLPATLGGTVNFSSLSSWSAASAGILIFGPSGDDYTFLETGAVDLSDGGWSISDLPPAGNVIIALVALSSGGEGVLEAQTLSVTGDDNAINFSPVDADKNLAAGTWHTRSVFAGSGGNWLLWIPGSSGTYVLDAEKIGNIDPYMYLYDGLTGSLIETNDDDGDGNNSRIQRDDFTAGYPYLIRVRDYFSSSGSYRFRAEAVSP